MPRPIDLIFPGRKQAMENKKCMPKPIGCGGDAKVFKDQLSQREYAISGLCQACQDTVFKEQDES